MEELRIHGQVPLKGEVVVPGAKNAITKMLVASLLSSKECIFTNVPNITEVEVTLELCKEIGMKANWDKKEKRLAVHTPHLKTTYVPQRFSGANRIPILMIGALLGRADEGIVVPTVGGCPIGKRPVTYHLDAIQALGAEIEYRKMKVDGAYFAHAHQGLHGCEIRLPYPSVGATENIMLAACRAKGTTVIRNAAVETEVIDLILFLQKLGVNIHLDINRTICIQHTKEFHEVEHRVVPDRIQAASYGMAALATKGRIFVEGAVQEHMITFLNKVRELRGGFKVYDKGIEFYYDGPLQGGLHIETDVHPGFMTDWQQPFVVLLSQANGSSIIHETVYENRFGYTKVLKEMGADIDTFTECLGSKPCRFAAKNFSHSIVIRGPKRLKGQHIQIPDLRAGFAYLLAALSAKGESTIVNLPYLDRGYESFDKKFLDLGANLERITIDEPAVMTV